MIPLYPCVAFCLAFITILFADNACLAQKRAPKSSKGTVQAYLITQHEAAWGTMELLVTKDRMKLTDKLRSYSIILGKPDYDIFYVATNRKVFATCPLKDFKGGFVQRISSFSGSTGKLDKFKPDGETMMCGVPAIINNPIYHYGKSHWQFFSARDIKIAPQISKFLSIFYDFPDVNGVVLRQMKGTNKARMGLDTTSVKKVVVPVSTFDPPIGYKKMTPEDVIFTVTDF